jgi:hypothetical protein
LLFLPPQIKINIDKYSLQKTFKAGEILSSKSEILVGENFAFWEGD